MEEKRPVGRGRGSRPPLTGGQPVRPTGAAPPPGYPPAGPSAPGGHSGFPPLGGGGDENLRVSF